MAHATFDQRIELVFCCFDFGKIAVNVVAVNHLALRGNTGLAGANEELRQMVSHLVADVLAQRQTGGIGFHHDVYKGDCQMMKAALDG